VRDRWTIGSKGKVVLIWDAYATHRDAVVKAKAKELKIRLIYISARMTDKS
jgi:hypothetical protein